jgi:spore coat polysaccharide biosynthesis protein SpsF
MSNVAIVLQARMGSMRLPGKVIAPVGGRSVLAHCIERLQHRSGLPVIVATTDLFEDDRVAAEAARMGAAIVRGSERDVLRRYVQAAREFSLTEIIRATADNPAVDMDAPRRTLELLHQTGADHVVEFGLPRGAAVEAVTVAALENAATTATDPKDREHVTTFIRRDRRFFALPALAPGVIRQPQLRLTVDTAVDLAFMRRVFARVGAAPGMPSSLEDSIAAAMAVTMPAPAPSRSSTASDVR